MKKILSLLILALTAGCMQAQMPVFRNQWTTNVPGAYVRGNILLGDPLGTFGVLTTGGFTNRGTGYFEGGTTEFYDGIHVQLSSQFDQDLVVTGQVQSADFLLREPQWNDVRIPLGTLSNPAAQPGKVTFRAGLTVYGFDDASTEQLDFQLQVPHGIETNNAYGIRLHIHWTGTNAIVGANSNVVWGLEYSVANPLEIFNTTTITNRVTNGLSQPFYHSIVGLARITNVTESAILVGRLFREGGNGGDNYAGDALGLSLDGHYPVIRMGSTNEFGDY